MRKLSFIFLMLVAFVFTVSAQRTFKHPGSILAVSYTHLTLPTSDLV